MIRASATQRDSWRTAAAHQLGRVDLLDDKRTIAQLVQLAPHFRASAGTRSATRGVPQSVPV
jgi:hypothetical protein